MREFRLCIGEGRRERGGGEEGNSGRKWRPLPYHYRDNNFRVSDISKGGEGSLSCRGVAARANVKFPFGFRRLETNTLWKRGLIEFSTCRTLDNLSGRKRRVPETDASEQRNI